MVESLLVDRDAIIRRKGLYAVATASGCYLKDAPVAPDFDGDYEAFSAWADELTQAEKQLAMVRCTVDKLYFIDNWVWFESTPEPGMWPPGLAPPMGMRQFKTWESQAWAIIEADQWCNYLVIKVRQCGATWIELAKMDQELNFLDYQNCAILSLDKERAQDALARLRRIHDYLRPWMRKEYRGKPGKMGFMLAGDSRVKCFATKDYGTVAGSYTRVFADEIALVESKRGIDLTEMMDSAIRESVMMTGGVVAGVTTGRARAGWTWHTTKFLYADLDGNQKPAPEVWSDTLLLFIPASMHPVWRDKAVYLREMKAQKDPQKFRREHPRTILEAFSPSGLCVFDADAMEWRYTAILTRVDGRLNLRYPPPRAVHFEVDRRYGHVITKAATDGLAEAKVYRAPKKGHRYICCADPSRGGSGTKSYCAAHVIDVETGEQVCVIHHKFKTAQAFARYLGLVGHYYNDAMLGWECNVADDGIRQLLNDEYPNLIRQPVPRNNSPLEESTDMPGYLLTTKSRALFLSELKEEILGDWLLLYDRETIEECSTFVTVVTNERTGAETERPSSGANDDLVMSLAGTVHFAREAPNLVWVAPEEPTGYTWLPDHPGDVQDISLPERQDIFNWPEDTVDAPREPRNFWELVE